MERDAQQTKDATEELDQLLQGASGKQITSTIYATQLCGVCISLVIGLLFYLFSTQPGYYGDENSCIYLRQYSYIMGLGTLIVCGILIAIILFSCATNNLNCMITAEGPINAIYGIFSLVLWIMLWVALAKGEDCGSLATLVWIFTWIIIIGFALSCCVICCGVAAAGASQAQR